MDLLSLAVGFLAGTASGAAGAYFADKYTDVRREKKQARERKAIWHDIEMRYPMLIAEMRSDFSTPAGESVRAFFVKDSRSMIGITSEPSFEYYTDKHPGLGGAVSHLIEQSFITDITPGNAPMYRVHEKLVDALLGRGGYA